MSGVNGYVGEDTVLPDVAGMLIEQGRQCRQDGLTDSALLALGSGSSAAAAALTKT